MAGAGMACHLKVTCLPAYTELSGFDFAASEINEAAMRLLHRCKVVNGTPNIVLVGRF